MATIIGTSLIDTLFGTAGADSLVGLDGDDVLERDDIMLHHSLSF